MPLGRCKIEEKIETFLLNKLVLTMSLYSKNILEIQNKEYERYNTDKKDWREE